MKALLPAACLLLSLSCSSLYYATMEQFGVEKRSILADRIKEGRDDQAEAKERFRTTLETFQSLTGFDGGELEDAYKDFSGELTRCERIAKKIHERIESIDDVATDLFDEWKAENEEYNDAKLRRQSETMLHDTRRRCDSLIAGMRHAESKMEPVLVVFRDQVRFLKHNLNAQAVASLGDTFAGVELEIDALVEEMERSIQEADAFIESLG